MHGDDSCPSSLLSLTMTTTLTKPSADVISDFFLRDKVVEPGIFLVHGQGYLFHASDY